jgi:hypothetical protein
MSAFGQPDAFFLASGNNSLESSRDFIDFTRSRAKYFDDSSFAQHEAIIRVTGPDGLPAAERSQRES